MDCILLMRNLTLDSGRFYKLWEFERHRLLEFLWVFGDFHFNICECTKLHSQSFFFFSWWRFCVAPTMGHFHPQVACHPFDKPLSTLSDTSPCLRITAIHMSVNTVILMQQWRTRVVIRILNNLEYSFYLCNILAFNILHKYFSSENKIRFYIYIKNY